MGRVRQERKRFRDWSLRPAFWAYTLVAFGLATLVCALCVTGLENLRMHSYARDYWDGYREYEIPAGGSYEMWADEDGMHYRILDAGGAEVALAEGDGVTARVTLGYMGETAGDEGGTEPNLIAVVPLMDEQQRTMSVLLTAASILCFPICYGGGASLDVERVMQVFENLVANAARFASARVQASVEWDGNRLVLSVRDDGPGFTPEGLRRGAEPFYRGDSPDKQGHLGLGLNICRVLCEACGGGLEIANARGGGARVRAWFGA